MFRRWCLTLERKGEGEEKGCGFGIIYTSGGTEVSNFITTLRIGQYTNVRNLSYNKNYVRRVRRSAVARSANLVGNIPVTLEEHEVR